MENPEILWAQTNEHLLLTFNIKNIQNPDINILKDSIQLKGSNSDKSYDVNLDLFNSINIEASRYIQLENRIEFVLKKESFNFGINLF